LVLLHGNQVILEFAPTFISIIMAGKMGSFITSSIGTMRVTEQIDALEVMGVNSLNYLVFPKITALLLYPFVIGIRYVFGCVWGMDCIKSMVVLHPVTILLKDYRKEFIPFHITYAFIKTGVFAFILATIPSFHGYYMKGGAFRSG